MGREFDIIFNNEMYGISWCNSEKISFAKYEDESFCQYYKNTKEFSNKAHIDKFVIKEIWKDIIVDTIY
jgi:hypothetical protein